MTCHRIKDGFLCGPDEIANLEPFGAHVWVEMHNYCGPTFYRSRSLIKPIMVPSKKTWDAFEKWVSSQINGG